MLHLICTVGLDVVVCVDVLSVSEMFWRLLAEM